MSEPRTVGADQYPVVASRSIFTGRVVRLHADDVRMSDGSVSTREVVDHPGAVGVVALDDQDRVVIVNQYRHPVRRYLDELPAGLLDVAGESPLAGAKRELFEEAGLVAAEWHTLIDLHTTPGMSNEAIRVFLARGLADAGGDRFVPEGEEITMTVARIDLDELVGRVLAGRVTNAAAVAGVLAAAAGRAGGWAGLRPPDVEWFGGSPA